MQCNSGYIRCLPSSLSSSSSSTTTTTSATTSSSSSVSSVSTTNTKFNKKEYNIISWTEYIIDLITNLISNIIINNNYSRSITGNIMQGLNYNKNNKNNNNNKNNVSVTTVTMLILLIFHQFLLQVTYAGPLNVRNNRMTRESYTELSTVAQNHTLDTLSTATCLLDGQMISTTSATCETKPGCRAIQKTGYCCPEYQCECERDGKTYSDGAKLDKIDPCNFCSCRGGEIVCSTVTCYNRDDCEPKFINGTCCPVYDNCPLIDTKITVTPSTTESIIPNSKLQPPQIKQEMMPKLNITIKEITKKEEIRIVGQNNPKVDDLINVKNTPEIKLDITDTLILSPVEDSQKIVRHTGLSNEKTTKLELQSTTTTIKNEVDIISESNNDIEMNDDNSTNIEHVTEQVIIIDKDGQSKTIQVFDTKGLQRGDLAEEPTEIISPSELIYDNTNLNNNNNNNNTEFLSFNSDLNLNDSYLDLIPNASSDFFQIIISSTPSDASLADNSSLSEDKVYDTILYTGESENLLSNNSSDSSDDEVFDTIYHDNNNNETILSEDQLPSSSSISPIDTDNYHIGHNVELEYDASPIENPAYPLIKDEDLSNYQREIENEDYPEGIQWTKSGTLLDHTHHHHNQHNHLKEEPRSSMENGTIISLENSEMISISNISSLYSKSLDDIKIDDDLISTEGSADDFQLTFDIPESRAPGEPCLIPEWERNITTTTNYTTSEYRCNNSITSNSNIFLSSDNISSDMDDTDMYGILKNNETEDTWRSSSESIELDLGSGSGMGTMMIMQQLKERESTTPHHINIIDIDDINNSDGSNNNNNNTVHSSDSFNPKDDAESVKYDDSNNSRTIDTVTV